ncbi:MAG: preprotein translocase subunit SecG [Bdellovibrionota bacterium]|mgnify:CR=1 FL=1
MQTLITVVHISTAILIVLLVLLQSGKGAEISASFGGSSQTVFGTSGGANFFTRFTSVAAAIFMATSILLTIIAGQSRKSMFEGTSLGKSAPISAPISAPAGIPASAPAKGDAVTQAAEKSATPIKAKK